MTLPLSPQRVAAPILRDAARLLVVCAGLAGVAFAWSVLRPTRFEARIVFSTVQSAARNTANASLASAILGGATLGLQPSAPLLVRLVRSQNTLASVGRMVVPGRSDSSVFTLLTQRPVDARGEVKAVRRLERLVDVSIERETGLVTLVVTHRDSALSRFLAGQLVDATTAAFIRASRAQALQARAGLRERMDTALAHLRDAEQRSLAFARANRQSLPDYSEAALTRDRLARSLSIATSVYGQVAGDVEAARARELEDTPALVVVDPIPTVLVAVPRHVVTLTLSTFLLALAFGTALVVIVDLGRRGDVEPAALRKELDVAIGGLARWRRPA